MNEHDPSDKIVEKYGNETRLASIAITAYQKTLKEFEHSWQKGNMDEGEEILAREKEELILQFGYSEEDVDEAIKLGIELANKYS